VTSIAAVLCGSDRVHKPCLKPDYYTPNLIFFICLYGFVIEVIDWNCENAAI